MSELASVLRKSVVFTPTEATLELSLPRKTQFSGPLQTLRLKRQPEGVCPVFWLQTYLERTDPLRGKEKEGTLFISLTKHHVSIGKSTLARWIKLCLQKAGIDIAKYTAHSTRGASASGAVAAGVPIDSVLKKANWASVKTFNRFYNRELNDQPQVDQDDTAAALLWESLVQSS